MTAAEVLAFAKDWVPVLQDVAVAFAAGIASYVGIAGLRTWQAQLKGTTEYQLAKNILVALYELRDAIKSVRDSYMEFPAADLPKERLEELSPAEKEWHAMAQEYQRRWDTIPPVLTRINTGLWEAEAVWPWGKEIASKRLDLNRFMHELRWAIRGHLSHRNPANRYPESDALFEKRQGILFRQEGEEGHDEFEAKVLAAIGEIEKELHRILHGAFCSAYQPPLLPI